MDLACVLNMHVRRLRDGGFGKPWRNKPYKYLAMEVSCYLIYVDDVVDAMLLVSALPQAAGEVFNLGGEPISLLDLAKQVVRINGKGHYEVVPFPEERKSIDIGSYYGDYAKICAVQHWKPKFQHLTGLKIPFHFIENI